MKWRKTFTLFRLYAALCAIALCAFAYAEYYGYILTGSDESGRETRTGYHGTHIRHK